MQFFGVGAEPDDVQPVAREPGADQGVEGQGDPLGGGETAVARHRAAHVEQQHRGAAHGRLAVVDLEVLRRQANRRSALGTPHGIHDRPPQVDREGVAKPVGPAGLQPLAAHPALGCGMAAERAAPQGGKDVQHGALGNAADAARRQFEARSVALHVRLQTFGKLLEGTYLAPRFVSHDPADQIIVDGVRIAAPEDAVQHPVKPFRFHEPLVVRRLRRVAGSQQPLPHVEQPVAEVPQTRCEASVPIGETLLHQQPQGLPQIAVFKD